MLHYDVGGLQLSYHLFSLFLHGSDFLTCYSANIMPLLDTPISVRQEINCNFHCATLQS
jgi:hypothetical protein